MAWSYVDTDIEKSHSPVWGVAESEIRLGGVRAESLSGFPWPWGCQQAVPGWCVHGAPDISLLLYLLWTLRGCSLGGVPCRSDLSAESPPLVTLGSLLRLKQFHASEWAGSANTAGFFSCRGLTFHITASSPSWFSPALASFLLKAAVVVVCPWLTSSGEISFIYGWEEGSGSNEKNDIGIKVTLLIIKTIIINEFEGFFFFAIYKYT